VAVAVRAARSIDSQSAIRSASSSPYWRKVRNFSGAFSGSTVTAEKTRLPYTALAAAYRGGGISAIPGGARLPPLRNAASAAHPAGDSRLAAFAASSAALRCSSLGSEIHFSVASSAVCSSAGGASPSPLRAHIQAHHTASRRGSRCARNFTASARYSASINASRYSRGPKAGRCNPNAGGSSSAMEATCATTYASGLVDAGSIIGGGVGNERRGGGTRRTPAARHLLSASNRSLPTDDCQARR